MSTAPAAIANSRFMLVAASGPDANHHRSNKLKLPGKESHRPIGELLQTTHREASG